MCRPQAETMKSIQVPNARPDKPWYSPTPYGTRILPPKGRIQPHLDAYALKPSTGVVSY
jgi:hypothetical protein